MHEKAPPQKRASRQGNGPLQEPVTRRDFLQRASETISATAVLGLTGVLFYQNSQEDSALPKMPEDTSDEALMRRRRKFAAETRANGDIPPEKITIDLKQLKLDRLEWGNVSGMYLNRSAHPAEHIEVSFTEAQNRLHQAKVKRLHKEQAAAYTAIALTIESELRKSNNTEQAKALIAARRRKLVSYLTPTQVETIKKSNTYSEKSIFALLAGTERQDYIAFLRSSCETHLDLMPQTARKKIAASLHTAHMSDMFFGSVERLSATMANEYTELYREGSHEPTTLDDLRTEIDSICDTFHGTKPDYEGTLDWPAIQSRWKFGPEAGTLMKKLARSINGSVLLACSMTELLPHVDGKINVKLYDLLARHAGKAFFSRIPSLGDNLPSFGPMQHTRYSINKAHRSTVDTLASKTSGASLIAPYVRSESKPIPDILEEVTTFEEHIQGAYLNAIFNLITCVRKIDDMSTAWHPTKRAERMAELGKLSPRDIAIFVSILHHRPKVAIEDCNKYLDARIAFAKKTPAQQQKLKPPTSLTEYTSKALELYARKTASNYDALSGSQSDEIPGPKTPDFPD